MVKPQLMRTAIRGATGLVVLAAFWLLLELVQSESGGSSWAMRKAAALRRRLAAAAAAGCDRLVLPSFVWHALRLDAGAAHKSHLH